MLTSVNLLSLYGQVKEQEATERGLASLLLPQLSCDFLVNKITLFKSFGGFALNNETNLPGQQVEYIWSIICKCSKSYEKGSFEML